MSKSIKAVTTNNDELLNLKYVSMKNNIYAIFSLLLFALFFITNGCEKPDEGPYLDSNDVLKSKINATKLDNLKKDTAEEGVV